MVSAHFQNTLPKQKLENLHVTHQAQVTRRGLSYKSVFLSSATVPKETFHCAKRLAVIQEEGPSEGLFEKYPTPPPPEIHNSTTPKSSTSATSAPGDPIEAGVFNAYNWAEDIACVMNQGLEVNDDMEPLPKNIPLVDTSDADTLFE